jgi:EAL domain-containing protein (putative c-di-GMP-specific phosphodiesterase class I)/CheY-like chemotaxis protein
VETIRVLIADDEADVRAALADLIASEDNLQLVGAARDASEAADLAVANHPDVAIIDVKMPGGGPRAVREILEHSPGTRVLALSAYEDRKTVLQMLGAGAVGYLVKGTSSDEIVRAIGRAVRGQTSVSTEVMAGVVSELTTQLEREDLRAEERHERLGRIRRVLRGEGMAIVYQPIWDLRPQTIVGMEALARFSIAPERPPNEWFDEAAELGLGVEMEILAIRAALADLHRLPDGAYLSVNLSHRTAMSTLLLSAIDEAPIDRLVWEITEHEQVEDYEALAPALEQLRARGGRVAIDDAGAGFASLRHTLMLNPDIIKLDISLTNGIDTDQRKRALAAALISFADELDMAVVAEGIETQEELDALLALRVRYGQGFYLARPAPLD